MANTSGIGDLEGLLEEVGDGGSQQPGAGEGPVGRRELEGIVAAEEEQLLPAGSGNPHKGRGDRIEEVSPGCRAIADPELAPAPAGLQERCPFPQLDKVRQRQPERERVVVFEGQEWKELGELTQLASASSSHTPFSS